MIFPHSNRFSYGKKTATAGTVINRAIFPPRMGTGKRYENTAIITDLIYNIGTTAHTITVMRPLNWTTFTANAAAAQAVVNIAEDPGTFQTAGVYKYPLPNGQTVPRTANNTLAGSDYVVFQCADGGYVMDTVSSVSSLAVTLTTNLPTGGVLSGGILWWFGAITDTDPATNEAHQILDVLAASSGTVHTTFSNNHGLWNAYHNGDPVILQSSNGTTAGTFELVGGYWAP
jgi:hypothetical protein